MSGRNNQKQLIIQTYMKQLLLLACYCLSGCVNTLGSTIEADPHTVEFLADLNCQPDTPLPESLGDGIETFGECSVETDGFRAKNINDPISQQVVAECVCENDCCRWNLYTQLCCTSNQCLWVHGECG